MLTRSVMLCGIQYHQKQLSMSSDVIIDTVPCLPHRRHLVPVPSSSRIGYRMIAQRNPSHAIPDTTPYTFLPAPSHRSYCFPPRFPPSVQPRLATLSAMLLVMRSAWLFQSCPPSKTSGEQAKRRTEQAIDDGEAKRYGIRDTSRYSKYPSKPSV